MPAVVHGRRGCWGYRLAAAEISHADGGVGAACDGESACVRRLELPWRRARCELGIPEDGAGRGKLVGDAQLRRGVGAGDVGGVWFGRLAAGERVPGRR